MKRGGRRAATGMAVVALENVGKRYATGAEILRDLSLSLEPGGFYFVTGASGSGKTTLLKLICLAETPSRGKVSLFEMDTELSTAMPAPRCGGGSGSCSRIFA